MSLIIATGSNQGDRRKNLSHALQALKDNFAHIASSRVYHSPAVDYLNQPDFYNQVLEFKIPKNLSPDQIMDLLLNIEEGLGRIRDNTDISKGPRIIDLDILFYATETYPGPKAIIPHPRLFQRSFVVLPLKELPYFEELEKMFKFPNSFSNHANPL